MHPIIGRARIRLVLALLVLALLAPAALAAAQYPRYWVWIAPELTPMTWLQTVLLMLAAATSALLAVVGAIRGWSRLHRSAHWMLAMGFAYLAIDDRFAIHERIRDRYLAPHDISIPGLGFLAPGDFQVLLMGVAGLVLLPVVLRALRTDRLAMWLFVLGVLCSVTAIGMDAIDPATMPLDVERLEQTLEECVELLAASFFAASLGVRLLGLLGSDQPVQLVAGQPAPDPAALTGTDQRAPLVRSGEGHGAPAGPGGVGAPEPRTRTQEEQRAPEPAPPAGIPNPQQRATVPAGASVPLL